VCSTPICFNAPIERAFSQKNILYVEKKKKTEQKRLLSLAEQHVKIPHGLYPVEKMK